MPIQQSDLVHKTAVENSDAGPTNGGKMSNTDATSSLFPSVVGSERLLGITRYRKLFLKNEQGVGVEKLKELALIAPKIYNKSLSPAEDYYLLLEASVKNDVQDDVSGLTGWAGAGFLEADQLIGDKAIVVNVDAGAGGVAGEVFQVGGTVRISDGVATEYHTIESLGAWAGDQITINLPAAGAGLANTFDRAPETYASEIAYNTSNTVGTSLGAMTPNAHIGQYVRIKTGAGTGQIRRIIANTATQVTVNYAWVTIPADTDEFEILSTYVSMCVTPADVEASANTYVVTSPSGGSLVSGIDSILLYALGCVDAPCEVRFTSNVPPYTFELYVDGSLVGSGATDTGAFPANGVSYYFSIAASEFAGVWDIGDTITFNTVSSAAAYWIKEVVPAGANPHSGNQWDIGVTGETA